MKFLLTDHIYDTDKAEILHQQEQHSYESVGGGTLTIYRCKVASRNTIARPYFWVSIVDAVFSSASDRSLEPGADRTEARRSISAGAMTEREARTYLIRLTDLTKALDLIPAPEA